MKTDIHYFLGIGQGKWSERMLSRQITGVTFHAAPNYLKYNTQKEFNKLGTDWVKQAIGKDTSVVIIAESQAAPAVVSAIGMKIIAPPRQLILIQPLGLNASSFGNDDKHRLASLMRRSLAFWVHKTQRITQWANFRTATSVLVAIIMNPLHVHSAFQFGANQNIVNVTHEIAKKINVTIYAAKDDSLFPYDEIKQSAKSPIVLKPLDGNHLNRATQRGAIQLELILKELSVT